MKKYIGLFICIIFLSSVLGCATQKSEEIPSYVREKCEVPVWNVGDTWRYRYSDKKEWQYTVERVEEGLYIVEDRYGTNKPCFDKRTLQVVAFLDSKGKKVNPLTPSVGIFDFPIYVGKKWKKMLSYSGYGHTINYLNEYEVISYEDVTVPAGTFKAFKIQMKQTNYAGNFASGKVYCWYSPEVKFIVKYEYEDIPYWRKYRSSELIRFELRDK